jgi:hypothetical protein
MMEKFYEFFISGALAQGGSWGGPECVAQVDTRTHMVETAGWLLFGVIAYYVLDIPSILGGVKVKDSECKSANIVESILDRVLSCVHFGMYLHLLYFKTNTKALIIVLSQPCHVILLLEGIALMSRGKTGVKISLFLLPALTGTLLAMLFPDTSGLYQWMEAESYWIQHYLIQAVPLYLLCRRDFQVARLCTWKTVLAGLWVLHMLHYTVYEGMDLLTSVNVEFMLCPTGAMQAIFDLMPPGVLQPSYRTPLTAGVLLVAIPIAYSYIFASRMLMVATSAKIKKKSKTV